MDPATTLPPLPAGAEALSLSTTEAVAVRSAVERVASTGAAGRRAAVEARTALSLLLGRSQSARRSELVRLALAGTSSAR